MVSSVSSGVEEDHGAGDHSPRSQAGGARGAEQYSVWNLCSCPSTRLQHALPGLWRRSERVHSRYTRQVADLPASGSPYALHLQVARFFCGQPPCPRASSRSGSLEWSPPTRGATVR